MLTMQANKQANDNELFEKYGDTRDMLTYNLYIYILVFMAWRS